MKNFIKTIDEFIYENINESEKNNKIKPNMKLKQGTGFPYAMFYISTQAVNIMVDFENKDHIKLIEFLAEQDEQIEIEGELTKSSIDKGRNMFLKILGEKVVYSKYYGADCTFRLSSTPDNENLDTGTHRWLKPDNAIELKKYI